jgi:hypothetical protein
MNGMWKKRESTRSCSQPAETAPAKKSQKRSNHQHAAKITEGKEVGIAQHTFGITPSHGYCDGKKAEFVIARLNKGGFVSPPFAMTCWSTEPPPALTPQIVTLEGEPPKVVI